MKFGEDYYGFIYKWTNSRNKKYYIGSHFGSIDDNYIGSGIWFKKAYDKEPTQFSREILEYLTQNDYNELLLLEQKYLSNVCEVGNKSKCYNISRKAGGGWQLHGKTNEEIQEIYNKISYSLKNRSPEDKEAALKKAKETIDNNPEKYKQAIEKSKETKKNWTEDRKKLMAVRMEETKKQNPEKYKQAIEKGKETKRNWTDEERLLKTDHLRKPWSEERRKAHREKLKLKEESRTEVEKLQIKINRSNAQKNRDALARKKSYEQGAAKFKQRSTEDKEESERKRLEKIAPKRLEINEKISKSKRKKQ